MPLPFASVRAALRARPSCYDVRGPAPRVAGPGAGPELPDKPPAPRSPSAPEPDSRRDTRAVKSSRKVAVMFKALGPITVTGIFGGFLNPTEEN